MTSPMRSTKHWALSPERESTWPAVTSTSYSPMGSGSRQAGRVALGTRLRWDDLDIFWQVPDTSLWAAGGGRRRRWRRACNHIRISRIGYPHSCRHRRRSAVVCQGLGVGPRDGSHSPSRSPAPSVVVAGRLCDLRNPVSFKTSVRSRRGTDRILKLNQQLLELRRQINSTLPL